ncbi:MAG TPA: serpin family protein, partial [Dehalococcoidia bacterium]|nr:serpin family protein [Dehalococcoidia bacterium]
MNKRLRAILAIILLAPLMACIEPAAGPAAGPATGLEPGSDQALLVEGNNAFAFDLYQALKGQEGNLLCSPYSISLALAMTYAGARNETADQMADTLHLLLE